MRSNPVIEYESPDWHVCLDGSSERARRMISKMKNSRGVQTVSFETEYDANRKVPGGNCMELNIKYFSNNLGILQICFNNSYIKRPSHSNTHNVSQFLSLHWSL